MDILGEEKLIKRNRWGQAPAEDATQRAVFDSNRSAFDSDLSAAAMAAREALEKAKKAAMFQKQIAEQMAKLRGAGMGVNFEPGAVPKARKLILDEFGRELDEEGNVMPMKNSVVSTLKVNINRERENKMKRALGENVDENKNKFFDGSLRQGLNRPDRAKRRVFRFVEEGSLLRKEERIAKKLQEKKLGIDEKKKEKEKKDVDVIMKEVKEEIEEEPTKKVEVKLMRRDPIPEMEWWDLPFLKHGPDAEGDLRTEVNDEKVNLFVEHPIPIKPAAEKEVVEAATMHLTQKERKKLRRLKRQERTQEIRDKIKMGIVQPPPPKVKMSNLMRVLGDEAVQDPSQVEKRVRQQVEQRRKEHEQRNNARKLNPEERKLKKRQKWVGDTSTEVFASVYKVKSFNNKRHLFKVDTNAQQFHLTGVCIVCPGHGNIVVVEGAARAVKRYKKLMVRRIKWRDEGGADDDEDEEGSDDEGGAVTAPKIVDDCILVWEGVVKTRNFKKWQVVNCKSEQEAQKLLAERGALHYWEMLTRHRDSRLDI